MKKVLSIVAASLACATAGAQTANFEGFTGALNLNTVSTTTKITADIATFDGIGQQSFNGSAQLAYGFVTSPSTVVTVGGTYALGSNKAGSFSIDDPEFGTLNIKTKNAYSLYVEPGFLLSDKTLAYGKLSYEGAKGELTFSESGDSKSIKGTGFGIGVRTMLDKTTFIQVEFKQVGYSSVAIGGGASFKPKATMGTIGFGMKF